MKKTHKTTKILAFVVGCVSCSTFAEEQVSVGLRWMHQFQFAGYYAAVDQGFYAQENLNVTLFEGSSNNNTIDRVLNNELDFGVANGELVLERLKGKQVVALSAIFQNSPSVLLTLASSGISNSADLKGKSIMTLDGNIEPEFLSMMSKSGVDIDEVNLVQSSFDLQDLIKGNIDAFNAYLPNEPFVLQKSGIDYHVLNPQQLGIDFYSDFLFTSQRLLETKPKVVEAFRRATLKGWRYALANPERMIHSIKNKWGADKSLNELRYEALAISNLVRSELVEIGYIKTDRINEMADVFINEGLIATRYHLKNFIYRAEQRAIATANNRVILLSFVLFTMVALCVFLTFVMRKLRLEIERREEIEERLRHLASIDPLTQLYNRRMFSQLIEIEEKQAKRNLSTYCLVLLDIDLFKAINDQYGHNTGDKVIEGVANTITNIARESDICARFGGEEFIVMLPNTDLSDALIFTQRLQQALNNHTFVTDTHQEFSITSSYGIVQWDFEESITQVIAHADDALYQAKRSGRDCIRAYRHPLLPSKASISQSTHIGH
ncbi:ABC transporter substrate-binding protein [Vibrio tapetis subsp. quintayensis]|uniref:GGDEF domain-containing protein n=1 Tax=Vibrio tapetis TaxID=52443 RepID=UPI0025B50F65|nr:GGDEF domain-containing protein [Vibrio tapetis]MDN3681888.1 ABC transporter substrate-binding protein [Vibrio tapetis subsp. quintayensis]